jgi:hypothetical protein
MYRIYRSSSDSLQPTPSAHPAWQGRVESGRLTSAVHECMRACERGAGPRDSAHGFVHSHFDQSGGRGRGCTCFMSHETIRLEWLLISPTFDPESNMKTCACVPVPAQTWAGWVQSRCRRGRGGSSPGADTRAVLVKLSSDLCKCLLAVADSHDSLRVLRPLQP